MIPYPYNFVDFGGVDLAEINGIVVEGIHDRIITALSACGEVVLYNWYFAEVPIAPSYCSIEVRLDSLIVNETIEIRNDNTVWVESLIPPEPEPPVLVPLSVTENGQFSPQDYDADGFSEVDVSVSESQVPLSYTIPDVQMFNSAGVHQLTLDSSYQHALVAIVARGDYSAAYTPEYEQLLDPGSFDFDTNFYLYQINPVDGFSFTSVAQRVTAWVIYTNRNFNFQATPIKAIAVSGQNTKYTMPNLEGNYFCLIYNSWTNESSNAVFQPTPIVIGSDKAVRYTYAILSSPKSTTYEYTLSTKVDPENNSNYVILIKEE